MPSEKRNFGNVGEWVACRFLISKGYEIIERNFYTRYGEIDIICSRFVEEKNREELFFVEVKTREKFSYNNYPEDAVDYNKKIRMDRSSQIYLNKKRIKSIFYSFSVIAIYLDLRCKKANIKFFERV